MKILLLTIFCFLTSFSTNQTFIPNETWIGTFEVFMTDNDEIIIYYNGNYHRCFTKYLIDQMYPECDSITTKLDTMLKLGPKLPVDNFKKVRM